MRERFVEEMSLYCAYHRVLRNRVAHLVAGPPILIAVFTLGCWTPIPVFGLDLSLGIVAVLALLVFHLWMDPFLALLASPFTLGCFGVAEWTTAAISRTEAWLLILACFGGGWVVLAIGHYFEGRAPSLAKSWRQPLISPLFYVAELLASLGIRSELWHEVLARQSKHLGDVASGSAS